MNDWLEVQRGNAPLIISIPHSGTDIPLDMNSQLASGWLARKDTDWWIHMLYDFTGDLDATVIQTKVSRTVIDVNRDPSGASLYPGHTTTDVCPVTTFDGEPLYRSDNYPGTAAIEKELARLRGQHERVVLYDAHTIRSRVPRLFDGVLPVFNIGTNSGSTCNEALTRAIEDICDHTAFSRVTNGRFKGGCTVRRYGHSGQGVHALQMELACRAYLNEPAHAPSPNWPPPYEVSRTAPLRALLIRILNTYIDFTRPRFS